METQGAQQISSHPLFDPTFINLPYFFQKIYDFIIPIKDFVVSGHTWFVLGFISSSLTVFLIGVIIFSLVRMREIQLHEKREIDHEIREALARDAEADRNTNPRWKYILTILESPNESDWRMAIIEADTMLDELLQERGFTGETLGERLKAAESSGFATLQSAWDAHTTRNQIAHAGSEFPITQVEARRVIKIYESVFEELGAI